MQKGGADLGQLEGVGSRENRRGTLFACKKERYETRYGGQGGVAKKGKSLDLIPS